MINNGRAFQNSSTLPQRWIPLCEEPQNNVVGSFLSS
jgi:hypothetical protein